MSLLNFLPACRHILTVLACFVPLAVAVAEPLAEPDRRPLEMSEALEALQKNVTAADIRAACSKYNRPNFLNRERTARRAMCNGFFFGVASTAAILRRDHRLRSPYCFPVSISTEQVTKIFMQWSEDKRDLSAYLAAEGVLKALDEVYPCASGLRSLD